MTDESPLVEDKRRKELEALNAVFETLNGLDEEGRQRVFQAVSAYYRLVLPSDQHAPAGLVTDGGTGPFSEDRSMSAKLFIKQKQPATDVERVACLAYYLTHYRDTPYFKTLDISKLNTEAAQPKLSNPTVSMDNATKMGYLVPATKGSKQLSVAGEVFVQKLPDREAARAAMSAARPRRKVRRGGLTNGLAEGEKES
jgi:hypothetical protein